MEIICVKKDKMEAEILVHFRKKYLDAGWIEIEKKQEVSGDETIEKILCELNSDSFSKSRNIPEFNNNKTSSKYIIKKELGRPYNKIIPDGLIRK